MTKQYPKPYQVLARRYRPQRFADVVGQEAILQTLKNAIRRGHLAHAYLFSGSRGVGKTTLARLFAKALNCTSLQQDGEPCNNCPSCLDILSGQSLDVIEIDGASNRGIDDIRQINETVAFAPSHGKYKIYIIDEVHMLTKEAFNALLKTLEEPPERAKFFFATTEPHKVLPTIISRCQRFDLGRLLPTQIIDKLTAIANDLSRTVDEEAIHLLAQYADGSLRDAESLFDQILCFTDGPVTSTDVRSALGLVPQDLFFALDKAFAEHHLSYAFELVDELFQSGKDLAHFLEQLIEHYRHIAVAKTRGPAALAFTAALAARYTASAALYSQPQSLAILDLLLKAEATFSRGVSPRVSLELTLLQVLRMKNRIPIEALVKKLAELEESLKSPPGPEPTKIENEPGLIPLTQAPEPVILPAISQEAKAPKIANESAPIIYRVQEGMTCSGLASQAGSPTTLRRKGCESTIDSNAEHHSQKGKGEKEDRLGKGAAGQNMSNLTERGIQAPEPIILASVPFSPYLSAPQAKPATPPLQKLPLAPSKHPSHYATLMRFASVELEGTIKN